MALGNTNPGITPTDGPQIDVALRALRDSANALIAAISTTMEKTERIRATKPVGVAATGGTEKAYARPSKLWNEVDEIRNMLDDIREEVNEMNSQIQVGV